MKIIGIDPGFAQLGWVIAGVVGDRVKPLRCGVIKTDVDSAKGLYRSSDNLRRARELWKALDKLTSTDVRAIAAEAMSFPRDSSAAHKVGICWGLLTALDLPIIEATPQEIKQAVTGRKGASKGAVEAALLDIHPEMRELAPRQKGQREHIFDALGAIHAAVQTEYWRVMMGGAKQ